jgi:putative tricarboxylic transport membrane protein
VPTAREQGYDVRWPIVRGFYVGPKVGDAEVREWAGALTRATATPTFAEERARAGLQAHAVSGTELQALVERSMAEYRALAAEFGLARP